MQAAALDDKVTVPREDGKSVRFAAGLEARGGLRRSTARVALIVLNKINDKPNDYW